MADGVLIALISGGFSLVVAWIHRGFKRQHQDHGIIADSLDRIENKIDRHIENHDR
jgi:Na+/melibiose symporter-like transporter